jgi:hypothetical integral membrane protein (TIGR02206 family)
MAEFFARDYTGGAFEVFGTGHLIFVGIVFIIALFLIFGWKNPSEKAKRITRYIFVAILLVWEGGWHLWNAYWGQWTIQTMIPLHICSVMVWASIVMLLTRSYRIYEFAYFLGIGGALQPLLTPEAGIYGLPHFRAFQTLIVHGTLVLIPIYMTAVEGYRPTWASFKRVAIGGNIYMAFVFVMNKILDSNFMFLMRKPDTASLMDVLGPWPWYLISLEVVAFLVFLLLYLPFIVRDARAKRKTGK